MRVALGRNSKTGFFTDVVDSSGTVVARIMNSHSPSACKGARGCGIHGRPSNHPLKDAPMFWRPDDYILERDCIHGVPHPDVDSALYLESVGRGELNQHICDGCCGM